MADLNSGAAAKRALREAALTHLADGLALIDLDGRVELWNPRMEALLGVPEVEALGALFEDVAAAVYAGAVDPEAALRGARAAREQVRAGAPSSFDCRLGGNPPRDLQTFAYPILGPQGTLGFGWLVRDVSAERMAERLKDEVMSLVGHEVRTPLASLVGFSELLLTRDLSDERRRQFLEIMVEEGRRLTALVNDFLDMQSLDSGRQRVSRTPLDLGRVLRRAAAAAGEDPERPIHLEVPEALPPVLADAERVHQVVANLLSNSRKYSPDGGEVRLIAHALDVAVQVEVSDGGLGIPPEALPRLFEKFYRVDAPDRSSIPGTGLGLAISKRIVEAHGGRMWAESAGQGAGTTMRFTLPLARSGATAGDVLVVEDEAGFAHLLEAELAERGLSATRASSGEEALLEVAARPPRALLLDLGLPDISGEEFLRRMREAGRAGVPVLVVTMQDVDVDGRRNLEALGARAVLRKGPGAAAEAARAVAQLLRRGTEPS